MLQYFSLIADTNIEKTNSSRKKKKLFVVSYCEEKSYLSVPYDGTDLEYDDFVQCGKFFR